MDTPVFRFLCPHEGAVEGCVLSEGFVDGVAKCAKIGNCLKRVPPEDVKSPKPMKRFPITVPAGLESRLDIKEGQWVVFIDAIAPEVRQQLSGDQPMLVLDHNDPDHDTLVTLATDFGGLDPVITVKPYDNKNRLVLYAPATGKEVVSSSRFLKLAPEAVHPQLGGANNESA
jgi:hypothetical protein